MNIEEIRNRRAAIDGAPWKYASVPDQRVYGTSPGGCNKQVSDYPVCEVRGWGHLQYMGATRGDAKAQAMQDANGLFIASAPQDIDFLLAEIERLRIPSITVLASDAVKRGEDAIAYATKQQGWDEDYARTHAEVVFFPETQK